MTTYASVALWAFNCWYLRGYAVRESDADENVAQAATESNRSSSQFDFTKGEIMCALECAFQSTYFLSDEQHAEAVNLLFKLARRNIFKVAKWEEARTIFKGVRAWGDVRDLKETIKEAMYQLFIVVKGHSTSKAQRFGSWIGKWFTAPHKKKRNGRRYRQLRNEPPEIVKNFLKCLGRVRKKAKQKKRKGIMTGSTKRMCHANMCMRRSDVFNPYCKQLLRIHGLACRLMNFKSLSNLGTS